jgi:hypothetical protein
MDVPVTHYARTTEGYVGYQVVGDYGQERR